jgi:hypothetical protein
VPGEHGGEERRQGYGPAGPGGLGLVEHQATGGGLHGPADLGHREVRIQVRPPKGQDLPPAHPGAQSHGGGDLHVGPGKQAQDPPGHGGVHHHLLGANGPRGPGPPLGHIPLSSLHPLDLQGLYSALLERRPGERGLSTGSVLNLHLVLTQALGQAVRWQLLGSNPAVGKACHRTSEA